MEKGAALRLTLIIMAEALASQSMANPVECRENEYLDNHGKCSPCKECGPGFELSKECGYGEGRGAECSPCQPRRFKDSWGVHGCKSCLSCALINRAQKSNCSTTSDATCGGCFPGFYSKTQIGGFQDLECVPCTKQTPSSEQQCLSRIGLEESSTDAVQDPALVVLMSSALVLLVLVLLTVAILYCQQFWKSQSQHAMAKIPLESQELIQSPLEMITMKDLQNALTVALFPVMATISSINDKLDKLENKLEKKMPDFKVMSEACNLEVREDITDVNKGVFLTNDTDLQLAADHYIIQFNQEVKQDQSARFFFLNGIDSQLIAEYFIIQFKSKGEQEKEEDSTECKESKRWILFDKQFIYGLEEEDLFQERKGWLFLFDKQQEEDLIEKKEILIQLKMRITYGGEEVKKRDLLLMREASLWRSTWLEKKPRVRLK